MFAGIALTILAGVLWGAIGIVYSRIARSAADFLAVMLATAGLNAAVAWAALPRYGALLGGEAPRLGQLALVMVGVGAITSLGMWALQIALRQGHQGACWTVGQSALVVPYLFTVAVLREPPVVHKGLGVLAIVGSLIAFGGARGKSQENGGEAHTGGAWFGWSVLALLLLGTQQSLSVLPSHWPEWSDVARMRLPFLYAGALLGYVGAAVFVFRRKGQLPWKWVMWLVALGLPSQAAFYAAQDVLAKHHNASIAYPTAVGTSILCVAMYSLVALREKGTAWHFAGLGLGLVGIALFAL